MALSEKKLKHVSQQCQQIFTRPKTSVLSLTKLMDLFSSTVQARTNPVSISSTRATISSTEKRVLQWSFDTGEFSQGVTPSVIGKLETLQWEENSATRTQYDHSDRRFNVRLWKYCKCVWTGGNGQRRRSIFT